MPATSDNSVFNFEGNMEQSFYDFLLDEGIELATANDPQRLGDDFIGVQFIVGALADDEHMSAKPDDSLEYDHYNFTVDITIHTDRVENSVPGAAFSRYHRELVAKVRNLLSISRAAQVASLNDKITLYWINRMIAGDTNYTAYDSSYDETALTYEGDFSILPEAWPV
tara:strand:- start:1419 stop:1922 length:504 start_codon:yes stop_codon:yes gene_type:complete